MIRVIKDYSKFHGTLQEEIYSKYSEGDLERTTFPYKGAIADGVIFQSDDAIYLIPISTIVAGRAGSSEDLDDDDDDDDDDDLEDVEVDAEADDEE